MERLGWFGSQPPASTTLMVLGTLAMLGVAFLFVQGMLLPDPDEEEDEAGR